MAATTSEAPDAPRDDGYTPAADWRSNWRNVTSYLLGNMTTKGQIQWRADQDLRNEEADCKRCEDNVKYLVSYSPTIRFMRENIQKLGSDINPDNIYCRRCPVALSPSEVEDEQKGGTMLGHSGGLDPRFGIKLCANVFRNRGHTEDTLAHEMIHAWDTLRFKVDHNDLRHAACMEVRASNLSGECRFMREFFTRGQWKITQQHQECVRKRAIASLVARPFCNGEDEAAKAVDQVWNSCTRDTRPFDEIYR